MVYCGQWRTRVRIAPEIVLTDEERGELTRLTRSKLTSVRLALRARIVLLAAQCMQNIDIAAQLGVGRVQVSRWRERYIESRLAGIERDLPRGAPPSTVDVARLVELTTQSTPEAATHWSTRTMAAELGVSAASVCRHWRKNGLKPHLVRGFKVSRDPRQTPKEKTLHLIADNYATHKHPTVQAWLAKHPRIHMHFTPTSASWLNMVERFFREITCERLRRGVFTSVPDLVAAIDEYIAHHNVKPKPFIWTKSARDILQKVIRANSRLSSKQNATLH